MAVDLRGGHIKRRLVKTPAIRLREGVDGPVRLVRAFNELREFSVATQPRGGLGIMVRETSQGTILRSAAQAVVSAAGGTVKRFLVTSHADDWLIGSEIDGDLTGVKIAKPYNLRKTGWHGVTVNYSFLGVAYAIAYAYSGAFVGYRAATINTTSTENQAIIPLYVANRTQVFAASVDNDTGVADADWIDLNADGRAWCRV